MVAKLSKSRRRLERGGVLDQLGLIHDQERTVTGAGRRGKLVAQPAKGSGHGRGCREGAAEFLGQQGQKLGHGQRRESQVYCRAAEFRGQTARDQRLARARRAEQDGGAVAVL